MSEWWRPSKSGDIKPIPWLAPKVIEHLESLLTPDMEVIEHGSGGSTLWFAERVKHVIAMESDIDWFQIVKSKCPDNARVLFGIANVWTWEENQKRDLFLIDGEPVIGRNKWLTASPNLVKPGGWVVLDNANRPEYAAEREWLKQQAAEYLSMDANEGGTRFMVTDFFKMKEGE